MTIKDAVVNAVAGAVIIATGGSLVKLKVNVATQDGRISRLEKLDGKIDTLDAHLQSVDLKLEHLNGRLEGERDSRQ